MMTPAAFQHWCRTLALPPATCDLLATIRASQPVRRVVSRANNMSGTYPSDKMGVTVQFESHKVELWVARFREAEEQLGCGYVGLLSRKASQGNYTPKAPSEPRELMDTFIAEQFETPRHLPAASVYRAYEQECRKRNLTVLSARAFYQRIKQRATPEQTEAREGARAAYQGGKASHTEGERLVNDWAHNERAGCGGTVTYPLSRGA